MNIIFNSSLPRSCSTLLQNILNQHPDFYATPTDGLIALLDASRNAFTSSDEFRASEDQELITKAWHGFCRGGIEGYCNELTDKPFIVLKGRGWKAACDWLEKMYNVKPVIICCVRDLKSIVASFEKLYRKNPDRASQWYIESEVRGTMTEKRVDMYLKNMPLHIELDRIRELIKRGIGDNILFIKAEDLTTNPGQVMSELYERLKVQNFDHDFNNIVQTTKENDIIHNLDRNLHTIRPQVTPLKSDAVEILGAEICSQIDKEYKWYQDFFGYNDFLYY
jgi:sulfotransferase